MNIFKDTAKEMHRLATGLSTGIRGSITRVDDIGTRQSQRRKLFVDCLNEASKLWLPRRNRRLIARTKSHRLWKDQQCLLKS